MVKEFSRPQINLTQRNHRPDAMKKTNVLVLVLVTWGLEAANVITRAEAKDLVTEARSGAF